METSQSLPIESFSYRWLINVKPSFDASDGSFREFLEASDEAAFIVMDPKMISSSKRFFRRSHDFNFPTSQSPPTILVDANEVFSNGLLMPYYLTPSKLEVVDTFNNVPTSPISSSSETTKRPRLSKMWKSWKRIVKKHLRFFRRHGKIQDSSCSSRGYCTRDEKIKACRPKLICKSEGSSPRISTGYEANDWANNEKSIQEAVLHCKRSFGRLRMS